VFTESYRYVLKYRSARLGRLFAPKGLLHLPHESCGDSKGEYDATLGSFESGFGLHSDYTPCVVPCEPCRSRNHDGVWKTFGCAHRPFVSSKGEMRSDWSHKPALPPALPDWTWLLRP